MNTMLQCQQLPDGIDVADMTADIRLLVVGEQMELDSMTAKHIVTYCDLNDLR